MLYIITKGVYQLHSQGWQLTSVKVAFFGGIDVYWPILPLAVSPTSHERCALSYNFIFLCFRVINIHSHTQKQRKINLNQK